MVTSRMMLQFDDLLSVINDAQLKSALNAYKEISQLIKRASEQRKRKAGDKLTVSLVFHKSECQYKTKFSRDLRM